jgi:hypothetical protein
MANKQNLSDIVSKKLLADAHRVDFSVFSDEVIEALRLSKLYATEKPKEYVLPLNAMAGFKMPSEC